MNDNRINAPAMEFSGMPGDHAGYPVTQEMWDGTRKQNDELCIFVNDLAAILEMSPFDLPAMLDVVRIAATTKL